MPCKTWSNPPKGEEFRGLSPRYSSAGKPMVLGQKISEAKLDDLVSSFGSAEASTVRAKEARHFIKSMAANLSMSLFGLGPCTHPPSQPITVLDAFAAMDFGRPEILVWIHAISEIVPYSRKPKRRFMDEWRAVLWDLADYLDIEKLPGRSVSVPVYRRT